MPSETVEGHFVARIAENGKYSVNHARIALTLRRIVAKDRVNDTHET